MKGTGSSGGSIGGGARGGTAVATRSGGGGKESGSFSGGRSFGNTARFESGFSGRALTTSKGISNAPRISISSTGNRESSFSKPATNPQRSEKRTGNTISSLSKTFGPKIESVRGVSHDIQRPESAFKGTKPLFVSKPEQKSQSKSKSEHPLYSGTHELSIPKTISNQDIARAYTPISEMKTMYTRPKEQTPMNQKPVEKSKTDLRAATPKKEFHPLYSNTREFRSSDRRSTVQPRITPRSYERNTVKNFTPSAKIEISPRGEIGVKQLPQYTGTSPEIAKSEPIKPQHVSKKDTPVDMVKRKAEKSIQSNLVKSNSREVIAPRKSQLKSLEQVFSSTKPLELQNAQTTTKKLQESGNLQKEQSKADVQKAAVKTVSNDEITKLLASYKTAYLPNDNQRRTSEAVSGTQLNPSSEQSESRSKIENSSRLRSKNIQLTEEQLNLSTNKIRDVDTVRPNPALQEEIKADVEQAARVMAAYQVLAGTDRSSASEKEAERVVLKALDQKLEKSHLKQQLITQSETHASTQVQKEVVTLPSQHPEETRLQTLIEKKTISLAERVQQTAEQPYLQTSVISEDELINVPEQQAEVVTESVQSEILQEKSVRLNQTSTQTNTQQRTATGRVMTEEIEETDEDIDEEEEMRRLLLELRWAYERDRENDKARVETAVKIAETIFDATKHDTIHGNFISSVMSQPDVYEPLKSDIVPTGKPDEYLTEIIEAIGDRKYKSVSEVKLVTNNLIARKPAITFGEIPSVSKEDVEKVKNSIRYPRK